MPLYKTITVDQSTKVLIWKIEESYETLCEGIVLTENSQNRVNKMKSELHRRGFMSVRHILAEFGYNDYDLYYDDFGKPYLTDGKQISITHSFDFAGVIISDKPIGVDIEKQREKITRIANKFTNDKEIKLATSELTNQIRILTIIWGAKESLYKLFATAGLSFEQHINIPYFTLETPFFIGTINYKEIKKEYKLAFIEFEGFTCVYAVER